MQRVERSRVVDVSADSIRIVNQMHSAAKKVAPAVGRAC